MLIKIADAAKRYNVTRQYLQKLHNQGKIFNQKQGKFVYVDTAQADSVCEVIPEGSTPEIKNTPAGMTSLTKASFALKMTKIEEQKLKNDLQKAIVVNKKDMHDKIFKWGRDVRDAVQSIPARMSILCEDKKRHDIEQIMEREINKILINLVDKFV